MQTSRRDAAMETKDRPLVPPATPLKEASKKSRGYSNCGSWANLQNVLLRGLRRPAVVAIRGPHGTFKTTIAFNFLYEGLENNKVRIIKKGREVEEDGKVESVLWIRFHERNSFTPSQEAPRLRIAAARTKGRFTEFRPDRRDTAKLSERVWLFAKDEKTEDNALKPRLIEIAFKSGALLPEEFIDIVRQVFLDHAGKDWPGIGRVVMGDVGMIGVAYPFLRKSSTAGDLFLPAFVHVMRNKRVDLVITGTTGLLKESDEAVNRACELADSVLHCELCDVFGDRHVIVTGDGLPSKKEGSKQKSSALARQGEFIPAVVSPKDNGKFEVDLKLLRGLVGFDIGPIHRPGLSLELFTEGALQKQYNDEIEELMRSVFSVPKQRPLGGNTNVSVVRFSSDRSDAVHDSLGVLKGSPIDRTVLCTVDEFHGSETEGKSGLIEIDDFIQDQIKKHGAYLVPTPPKKVHGLPYYTNVLLLAYRKEILKLEKQPKTWKEWADQARAAAAEDAGNRSYKTAFDFDLEARETLTCATIDAVVSGYRQTGPSSEGPLKDHLAALAENIPIRGVGWKRAENWHCKRGAAVKYMLTDGLTALRQADPRGFVRAELRLQGLT